MSKVSGSGWTQSFTDPARSERDVRCQTASTVIIPGFGDRGEEGSQSIITRRLEVLKQAHTNRKNLSQPWYVPKHMISNEIHCCIVVTVQQDFNTARDNDRIMTMFEG